MLKRAITTLAAAALLTLAATAAIASADHTDGPPDDLRSGDVYTVDKDDRVKSWFLIGESTHWWVVRHDHGDPGASLYRISEQEALQGLMLIDALGYNITHSRPYDPPASR